MFMFEGTPAECLPRVLAWPRPAGLSIQRLDIADVCAAADSAAEARQLLEAELSGIGRESGRSIVLVDGLHLMPTLYPGGPLQPLLARLRSGGRVLLLIAPPPAGTALPEVAQLDDWRTVIRGQLGGAAGERTIIAGGASP